MGGVSLLFATESPHMPRDCDRPRPKKRDLFLLSKVSIPVFWLMLFDRSSIVDASEQDEEGKLWRYPCLSRSKAEGLALARSRSSAVCGVLGNWTTDLFSRWAGYIEAVEAPYIHCETIELAFITTAREFGSELRTCLDAFDHVPRRPSGKPRLNRWWRRLLGQNGALGPDDSIAPLGEYSYCGYGGDRVPWSDNNFKED